MKKRAIASIFSFLLATLASGQTSGTGGGAHPSWPLADSLVKACRSHIQQGGLDSASTINRAALAAVLAGPGRGSQQFAAVLFNDGFIEHKSRRYRSAEGAYQQARAVLVALSMDRSAVYASVTNNLAVCYREMGRFSDAIRANREVIDIRGKLFGTRSVPYANSLENLANVYDNLGEHEKAELLYLESKGIRAEKQGTVSEDYASTLDNLGTTYHELGRHADAEACLSEAARLRLELLGPEDPDYAFSLFNLAYLYHELGQYQKAEPLFIQSAKIMEAAVGADHPDYANQINMLAGMYCDMGRFAESDSLYQIGSAVLLNDSTVAIPDKASCLNQMAVLYHDMGRFDQSATLFERSMAMRLESLGRLHPYYAQSLDNFSDLCELMGQFPRADSMQSEKLSIDFENLTTSAKYLSSTELAAIVATFETGGNMLFSRTFARPAGRSGAMPATSYDNALFIKGFLLQVSLTIKHRALADTIAVSDWGRLVECQRLIAQVLTSPIAERDSANLLELQFASNQLEKRLARRVEGFGDAYRPVSWRDVQTALRPDEAAIEFVSFAKTFPKKADSTIYAALVIRPGWPAPRFVPLFEEKGFTAAFRCDGPRPDLRECALKRYGAASTDLYQLVFAPLDSLLAGAATVFYSPTGQLNLLDFGALATGGGRVLADRYRLVRLGSTRSVADYGLRTADLPGAAVDKSAVRNPQSAILFGGVFHNFDSTAIAAANDSLVRGGTWRFLPGTQKEVDDAARRLEKKGIATRVLTGHAATEGAFKHMASSGRAQRVVHMAVHGFFYEKRAAGDTTSSIFETSPDPLLRAGLLLAGADRAFQKNRPAPADTLDDGVLTALEISQCDLRGTELVVLSACQSGLGDLRANEGVYGLQRAFKIAGARHLLMSLQEVPDRSAQEFTSLFYEKWLGGEGLPLPVAFRAAQAEMRHRHPDRPHEWAGWVLLE